MTNFSLSLDGFQMCPSVNLFRLPNSLFLLLLVFYHKKLEKSFLCMIEM